MRIVMPTRERNEQTRDKEAEKRERTSKYENEVSDAITAHALVEVDPPPIQKWGERRSLFGTSFSMPAFSVGNCYPPLAGVECTRRIRTCQGR